MNERKQRWRKKRPQKSEDGRGKSDIKSKDTLWRWRWWNQYPGGGEEKGEIIGNTMTHQRLTTAKQKLNWERWLGERTPTERRGEILRHIDAREWARLLRERRRARERKRQTERQRESELGMCLEDSRLSKRQAEANCMQRCEFISRAAQAQKKGRGVGHCINIVCTHRQTHTHNMQISINGLCRCKHGFSIYAAVATLPQTQPSTTSPLCQTLQPQCQEDKAPFSLNLWNFDGNLL